tara:strand:+ start:11670 stop:11867 length:198 start_codon:yes stop_codon:yes gene_type:complete
MMNEIDIQDISDKDLKKTGFIVDLLPKKFPKSAMFQMSGMIFLHVRNKYCVIVNFENELLELPKA